MSIASRVHGLFPFLTLRLNDSNYLKWSFQVKTVLRGHGMFGYLDGSIVCPPEFVLDENGISTLEVNRAFTEWDQTDKALTSLLMASVTEESMEYILDCSSAHEAWINVRERYNTDSRATIMQLKTDFQTLQKGADSVERFLLKIKHVRAQLAAVGVQVTDDDAYVVALNGLPDEFDPVKAVLRGHQGSMSMKEFRSQLLAAEQDINKKLSLTLVSNHTISAMVAKLPVPKLGYTDGCNGHTDHTTLGSGGSHTGTGNSGTSTGNGSHRDGGYGSHLSNGYSGGYNNSGGSYNTGGGGYTSGGKFNSNGGRGWNSEGNGGRHINWGNTNVNNWNNGSRQVPECQICSRRGHTAVNCFDRDRTSQNTASSVVECQICGKRGHVALDCFNRYNYAYQGSAPPQTLNALTAQANVGFATEDVWIANTGATHHMTADLTNLTMAEPFEFGNGEGLGVKHIGF